MKLIKMNILIETRCDKFKEQITNEAFIIFFEKVLEYSPKKSLISWKKYCLISNQNMIYIWN